MIQALVLGVLSFIAIYIALSQIDTLKQKHKIGILLFSLLLFGLFTYIEDQNEKYRDSVIEIKREFTSGKTIVCGDRNISSEKFTVTSNSFVAKKDSSEYGLIVPLVECFKGE